LGARGPLSYSHIHAARGSSVNAEPSLQIRRRTSRRLQRRRRLYRAGAATLNAVRANNDAISDVLNGFRADFRDLRNEIKANAKESSDSHADIAERIDSVEKAVIKLDGRVSEIESTMKRRAEIVERIAGGLFTLLVAILAWFKDMILAWFHRH